MQFSLFDDGASTSEPVTTHHATFPDVLIPSGFAAFAPLPSALDHLLTIKRPRARPVKKPQLLTQPQPVLEAPQPPARVKPLTGFEYEGYPSSSTYLVDLYISQDQQAMERVHALLEHTPEESLIKPAKLAAMFQVRRTTAEDSDDDDYWTGLDGNTLILDYWAQGEIDWDDLAQRYTREAKELLGHDCVDLSVLEVLGSATVEGHVVRLNSGQLPRDLYLTVDKLLKSMGSHWNRKLQGHVFAADPTPMLEQLLSTGYVTKPDNFGEFFTPEPLALEVVALADLDPGMRLLEPNAGNGSLLRPASEIVGVESCFAVEMQPHLVQKLKSDGFTCYEGDFLSQRHWGPSLLFDRALMNPPFAGQADIDHVLHAWSMLARRGRLVAIMSAGVQFRQNAKTQAFRKLVESVGGQIKSNPPGSFKSSGTNVHTVTVIMDKPDSF